MPVLQDVVVVAVWGHKECQRQHPDEVRTSGGDTTIPVSLHPSSAHLVSACHITLYLIYITSYLVTTYPTYNVFTLQRTPPYNEFIHLWKYHCNCVTNSLKRTKFYNEPSVTIH